MTPPNIKGAQMPSKTPRPENIDLEFTNKYATNKRASPVKNIFL